MIPINSKIWRTFHTIFRTKKYKMFNIFHILYNLEGKNGNRYRRKDAIYLLFQIIEDRFSNNKKFMDVFEFTKNMFFRKQMKERPAFGIWLILMVWKFDDLDFNDDYKNQIINQKDLKDYLQKRTKIPINEDYVIKDYHVNKDFGLKSFGKMGCVVIDEDLSILGDKGEEYKEFYIKKM